MFANTQMIGVTSPLGPDALGLASFTGTETLSGLFSFELSLFAPNKIENVAAALLGKPVGVNLEQRHFQGICSRVSQGRSNSTHTAYRAEVVPWLWLLSLGRDNRSFTERSVPEILQQVLQGGELQLRLQGSYGPRPYVAQRNESDFAFVSRLMEEEGIFYFFEHSPEGHRLVLGDSPAAHNSLPAVQFDGDGERKRAQVVHSWERAQELRPGKVTLWDHCFELPDRNLEGTASLPDHLRTAATGAVELYDYPGGYAERLDGVDTGGGERPAELQKLFPAATRAAELRSAAEAADAVTIEGASSVRSFTAGATFGLERSRFDGKYLITSCTHRFSPAADRARYANAFTCIPDAVPFRPRAQTPKPVLAGTETAVVVGPPGQQTFADKYARVKVKFPWMREEGESSSWVRVAHAPDRGFFALPEVGDEVLVAFEHGDPDRPYVLGSLWNAADMPPPRETAGD